jgi:mersacidin/lichenicidin family type 2 lantibiotic
MMSRADVVRAWKDAGYRATLSDSARDELPSNPAGMIDLSDVDLDDAAGARTELLLTLACCGGLTSDTCLCTIICPSFTCTSGGGTTYMTYDAGTAGCGSKIQ